VPPALLLEVEVERLPPARVDQATAELEVAPLPRHPVQLDERQLDLLVAVVAALAIAARAELAVDQVGEPGHDVEHRPLAGGLVVRDGALDQVSGAVQLVGVPQAGEPLPRLDHREVHVQVTVVLLRAREERDRLVHGRLQVRVRRPGRAHQRAARRPEGVLDRDVGDGEWLAAQAEGAVLDTGRAFREEIRPVESSAGTVRRRVGDYRRRTGAAVAEGGRCHGCDSR